MRYSTANRGFPAGNPLANALVIIVGTLAIAASVVLGFVPLETHPFREGELEAFRKLVKNLFGQRRKTIQNTLKSAYGLDAELLAGIQQKTGIELGSRPEQLRYEQFLDITRALEHKNQE